MGTPKEMEPEKAEPRVILLVDDEMPQRELLAELLSDKDDLILQAGNGQEALDILSTKTVHAVISDYKMPVMDGLQLLAEMRNRGYEIPSLILTSFADKEAVVTALRLGAVDFIEKPYSADELCSRIDAIAEYGFRLQKLNQELTDQTKKNQMSESEFEQFKKAKKGLLEVKYRRGSF